MTLVRRVLPLVVAGAAVLALSYAATFVTAHLAVRFTGPASPCELFGDLGRQIPFERSGEWVRNDIGSIESPDRLLPPGWECRAMSGNDEVLASEVHPSRTTSWSLLVVFTAVGALILRQIWRRRE